MGRLNIEPRTIFCHDNLDVLRGINSDCTDLVYLDPPFNKKKTFTAPIGSSAEGAEFSDIFREEDIKDEWVGSIEFENPELHEYLKGVKSFSNRYNYCYLVYMAVRLIECRRILKNTGSVYLHCDPTMSHYLKIVMDCVFGEGNFRNEVIWWYDTGGMAKKGYSRKHDVLLYYAKNDHEATFNVESIKTLKNASQLKRFEFSQRQGENSTYRLTSKYKYPHDVWQMHAINPKAKERTGYPTQKPLALLERIIKASSNEGDMVLDPFCGCATTCVAAEKLGRKWIGVDVSHKAYDLVKKRLEKEVPADLLRAEPNFQTTPPKRDSEETDKEKGFVYVIRNSNWDGFFKVGIAKNVQRRLNSYQTSDPYRAYEVAYSLETSHYKEIEKVVHEKYTSERYGEWVEGDLEGIKHTIHEEAQKYGK